MKKRHRLKHVLAGLAMITIASVLLVWCLRQIDSHLFWRDLSRASFLYLIVAMGCIYGILLINTWQWQLFLPQDRPFSFQRMFRVIRVMQMMANILPWGNAFAVYHLGQGERLGKTEAVSVMTLDQVTEGFSKLAIFFLISLIVPLPLWMKQGIHIAVISIIVTYLCLLFFAYRHREFEDVDLGDLQKLHHKIFHLISKWAHHLHAVRNYKKMIATTFLAILMKVCEVGAVYFVQVSFGVNLPLWSSFFLVAAYNLATMVPITPGNIGIFEATAFFIYKSMGVEPTQAMSLALFNHLVYLVPMVVPGYWVSVRLGIKLGKAFFERDSSDIMLKEKAG
jgi:uncharacterized protein (TIRG00374 family)